MSGVIEYLFANPIFLVPILLLVATMLFAILKRLLKVAAIVAIAAALYVVLVDRFGAGVDLSSLTGISL
ncbi:MAG: hypothetical protein HKN71_07910 [Gemmatimonadetes bacterium]|nr:hypothetical protein [Gemmatimonadota bacterium]